MSWWKWKPEPSGGFFQGRLDPGSPKQDADSFCELGFFGLQKMANTFRKELRCSETGTHWKKTHFFVHDDSNHLVHEKSIFLSFFGVGKQQGPILILGFGFF